MSVGAADKSGASGGGAGLGHLAIRASAGTGKTYQLTNRYLRLLAEGEKAERILAATFTRKAAGEVFERIVERLTAAAGDEAKASALGREVGVGAMGAADWGETLARLLRGAHRLNVGTLDSIYVRIAQAFALELNLPPSWGIGSALQERMLRSEALTATLDEADPQWLIEAVRLLNKGESRASVAGHVDRVIEALHGVYLDAPEAAAWLWLDEEAGGGLLGRAELAGAIEALREAEVEEAGKALATAKRADWERALEGAWGKFLTTGLPPKVMGEGVYRGKPIPGRLAALYGPLIGHAKSALLKGLADQNRASYQLVERFDGQYHERQRAKRMLRFEDVTRQLALSQLTERWEGLLYRLDARFDHLLLDEFQDTSRSQWRVIRPLAREIASNAPSSRSFFCVGDVKQSIYGWRGGEPEIFRGLESEFGGGLEVGSLRVNRRSGPDVIETVNAVFEGMAGSEALRQMPEAAGRWLSGFGRHEAHQSTLPGYCVLEVAAVEPGAANRPALLREAAERVKGLSERMAEAGGGRSIAMLTRTNASVARLIAELRRLGTAASQEGGNPLTDSPAVSVVLSLLQLSDHPSDTAAAFHVGRSPLGPAVGIGGEASNAEVREAAASVRGRLVNEGYGPVVEGWALALAASCGGRDARRLEQLAGLAWAYDESATLRPSDFVEHVRAEQVEEPTSAAVRVMTIHQAKGLQFDAVVLAELDKPLIDARPRCLVDRPEPTGEAARVSQPGNKETRALSEGLARMYEQHLQRAANDGLSGLYVAMTRAKHGLYMLVPPWGGGKGSGAKLPTTFAGAVWGSLVGEAPPSGPGIAWERGDPAWWEKIEAGSGGGRGKAGAGVEGGGTGEASAAGEGGGGMAGRVAAAAGSGRRRMLARQTPSRLAGGGRVDIAAMMRPSERAAAERGTLMHAWFERVEWIEDGEPNDSTLRAIASEAGLDPGGRDAETVERYMGQFREMLSAPAIRAALSRTRYVEGEAADDAGVEVEVARERPFATRDGERMLEGVFDRLVVRRRDGAAEAGEVLDYKTDNDSVEAIVDRYRPQLAAYRRAAGRLLGLEAGAVTTTLALLHHGTVATV